jgi:hypothetical protein
MYPELEEINEYGTHSTLINIRTAAPGTTTCLAALIRSHRLEIQVALDQVALEGISDLY